MKSEPSRGEIWLANLEPVEGHEQGGKRPCLVCSHDSFNHGAAGLVVVIPLTTKDRRIPLRVQVDPPEGGVKSRSFLMPEMIRSVSTNRLAKCWGKVSPATLAKLAAHIQTLLDL